MRGVFPVQEYGTSSKNTLRGHELSDQLCHSVSDHTYFDTGVIYDPVRRTWTGSCSK